MVRRRAVRVSGLWHVAGTMGAFIQACLVIKPRVNCDEDKAPLFWSILLYGKGSL